jgi:putative acetyltransferase
MIIRNEKSTDIEAISEVTLAAFQNLPISHHTEQFIIKGLRDANALTISLVAEIDGKIVGHIAFSPVTISDGSLNWHGLGPVSVLPEYQKQGIGKSLIQEGLSLLRVQGSSSTEAQDVAIDLIASENHIPKFLAMNQQEAMATPSSMHSHLN